MNKAAYMVDFTKKSLEEHIDHWDRYYHRVPCNYPEVLDALKQIMRRLQALETKNNLPSNTYRKR